HPHVFGRVHAHQIAARRRARLDDGRHTIAPVADDGVEDRPPLGPFGVARRRVVFFEPWTGDQLHACDSAGLPRSGRPAPSPTPSRYGTRSALCTCSSPCARSTGRRLPTEIT